jgi:hypothetical protein
MHLCACVSEEGGDVEGAGSDAPSLLSYTLKDMLFHWVEKRRKKKKKTRSFKIDLLRKQ